MALRRCHLLAACAALLASSTAAAQQTGWDALEQPARAGLLRHALAPGYSDPEGFDIARCETQRNLDHRGRAQARALGDAIRARGIRVDRVISSEWCRCRETAELLGLGPVETVPMLNSFFEDRSTAAAQTEALQAYLAALPPDEKVLIVTHQVNISALTGRSTRSGEMVVITTGMRKTEVLGSVLVGP